MSREEFIEEVLRVRGWEYLENERMIAFCGCVRYCVKDQMVETFGGIEFDFRNALILIKREFYSFYEALFTVKCLPFLLSKGYDFIEITELDANKYAIRVDKEKLEAADARFTSLFSERADEDNE